MKCNKCDKEEEEKYCLIAEDGNVCRNCFCEEFVKNFKRVPGAGRMLGILGGKLPGVAPTLEVLALQTWAKLKRKNKREVEKSGLSKTGKIC